jgi:peptidoglycan/LPS O-acetylase OafA/YrhL
MNKIIRYTVPFIMAYAIETVGLIVVKKTTVYSVVVNFIDGGVGPGSYYYPIMIQFIFVFPFIYSIVKKYDFMGIILCFFINGMYEVIQRSYGMALANYRLLVFRYIFLMGVGCYLYMGKKKPKIIFGILSMLIGACWLIAYCYLGYQPLVIIYWGITSLLAALWIVPIVWVLLKNPKMSQLKCKPLEEMGKASYNIFLTQMLFFYFGAGILYKIIPIRALQLIICILVSTLVGYVFYLIESKITNRISKRCKEHDYWSVNIHRTFEKIETMMTK